MGKKFAGWQVNTAVRQPGEKVTINVDTTIVAVLVDAETPTEPTDLV